MAKVEESRSCGDQLAKEERGMKLSPSFFAICYESRFIEKDNLLVSGVFTDSDMLAHSGMLSD